MADKKEPSRGRTSRTGNITTGPITGIAIMADSEGANLNYTSYNGVAAPANVPFVNENPYVVRVDGKIEFNVGSKMKNTEMVFICFLEGKETALKKIAISEIKQEEVISDIEKLIGMVDVNVVGYLHQAVKEQFLYIAMDLVEGRESLIDSGEVFLKQLNKKKFLMDVTKGLKFLHEMGVVHGALDPSNILLSKSKNAVHPRLFNHALKKPLSDDGKNYAAPEVFSGGERTKSSDIFSLCGIFYFVLTDGEYPFSYGKKGGMITCNYFGENKILFQENVDFSNFARDLINKMRADKPEDRPNIDVVLKDPYFLTGEKVMSCLTTINKKRGGNTQNFERFKKELNKKEDSIVGPNWTQKIDEELLENINKRLKNPLSSVSDLVFNIRHKHEHREDLDFQDILKNTLEKNIQGNSEEDIAASHLRYWGSIFPELLTKLYQEYYHHFPQAVHTL